MNTLAPNIPHLAAQLLAGLPAPSPPGSADPAAQACEMLRGPLTKLAGTVGFASLLSRALMIAQRQAPALAKWHVGADGVLEGFSDAPAAEATRQGGMILLSELLSLLVTFIGEPLTLRLMHEAWPKLTLKTLTPRTEAQP